MMQPEMKKVIVTFFSGEIVPSPDLQHDVDVEDEDGELAHLEDEGPEELEITFVVDAKVSLGQCLTYVEQNREALLGYANASIESVAFEGSAMPVLNIAVTAH